MFKRLGYSISIGGNKKGNKKGKSLSPIHEASADLDLRAFSSSSCGSKMALKPRTVPILSDTVLKMKPPARYYKTKGLDVCHRNME
jgi:hypothetical protein